MPDAVMFTFALLLAEVLWIGAFAFGVWVLDWYDVGISHLTRRVLVVGTVIVMVAVTFAGAGLWVASGSFHPVYVIFIIMGLMPLDVLRYTKRLPGRKPVQ